MSETSMSEAEVTAKMEEAVVELRRICPTIEELREVLVFLFAASLRDLTPAKAARYLVRVTRLLDVRVKDLKRALHA